MTTDCGGVTEDANPEYDHHCGRELTADTQLVTQVHDQRRNEHVGDERDHEHLRVEDAVEAGTQAAEGGVGGGDEGDWQVGLEPVRHGRAKDETGHYPGNECERGD